MDNTTPLVSVLMGTHNRLEQLPRSIGSVLAQTEPNLELVLINDGGGSVEGVVERFADSRIRLIERAENRGKGHSINEAFEHSRGAYIAHLDDDDEWLPMHLEKLLAALRNTPGARMAYSNAEKVTLRSGGTEAAREVVYDMPVTIAELIEYNFITGITVVHDRQLFSEAGGMDEQLDVLLDWDLWRRMAAITDPIHVNEVTARYFVRDDGTGHLTGLASTDPVRYMQNRLCVLDKEFPLPADDSLGGVLEQARKRGQMQMQVALGEEEQAAANPQAAKAHYEQAAKLFPQDPLPWRMLGLLAVAASDHKAAFKHFARCLNLHGAAPADAMQAASAAMQMGQPERAKDVLGVAVAKLDARSEGYGDVVALAQKFGVKK